MEEAKRKKLEDKGWNVGAEGSNVTYTQHKIQFCLTFIVVLTIL